LLSTGDPATFALMEDNVLGTSICPTDFTTAARRHGRHFSRYLLAARQAGDKRILDAACGGGFGAAYMARTARSVLGVDLDDEMLRIARSAFSAPNLTFARHDLHDPFGPDVRFDLITSFETMEHVRDPDVCIANFARAMAPDGVLMLSVPNGAKELRDGDFEPSHLVHFSADDLSRMTGRCFAQVEPYSQVLHRGLAHYARKLIGTGRHHAKDYRFVPGFDDAAKVWLAICRGPRV
jgi:2-polyprenyl-3-methyl-5-hydroxy-6-metoxy-1,4-benzoquinol methylase